MTNELFYGDNLGILRKDFPFRDRRLNSLWLGPNRRAPHVETRAVHKAGAQGELV